MDHAPEQPAGTDHAASRDDAFVAELRRKLQLQGVAVAMELSAEAFLLLAAPDPIQPEHKSPPFRLVAPIGAIEQDDLRWYLEEYYRWPAGLFQERAAAIEAKLPLWARRCTLPAWAGGQRPAVVGSVAATGGRASKTRATSKKSKTAAAN